MSWVLNLYWALNCWDLRRQARPCSCSKQTPDSLHSPHTPKGTQQQQMDPGSQPTQLDIGPPAHSLRPSPPYHVSIQSSHCVGFSQTHALLFLGVAATAPALSRQCLSPGVLGSPPDGSASLLWSCSSVAARSQDDLLKAESDSAIPLPKILGAPGLWASAQNTLLKWVTELLTHTVHGWRSDFYSLFVVADRGFCPN